jgi:hypothetical protein
MTYCSFQATTTDFLSLKMWVVQAAALETKAATRSTTIETLVSKGNAENKRYSLQSLLKWLWKQHRDQTTPANSTGTFSTT